MQFGVDEAERNLVPTPPQIRIDLGLKADLRAPFAGGVSQEGDQRPVVPYPLVMQSIVDEILHLGAT